MESLNADFYQFSAKIIKSFVLETLQRFSPNLLNLQCPFQRGWRWSHDQWVTWLGGWDTLTLNHKAYSKNNRKIYMYYKLRQACVTNWGSFVLLQIRENVFTSWGSYYKLGQPLLQNRAAITNWGKIYYKLGQVLQIRAIITNWNITASTHSIITLKETIWRQLESQIFEKPFCYYYD